MTSNKKQILLINISLLLIATAIWGYGFIATRWTLEILDPYWSNALRFTFAGVLSLPLLLYKKSFTRKNHILKKAFISSLFLLGVLLFQTIGLSLTTVAKSGFITTLYTLFIPITTMFVFGKKYRSSFWFLILMALMGMALMCNLEMNDINKGDLFTLICSFSGAFHIIYVGHVANTIESPIEFNFLQNFFVGVLSIPIALIMSGPIDIGAAISHSTVLKGLLFLSIVSSMISFTIQVVAQRKIPDHIAGLVFLMESPFAALFGFLILGEMLNVMNLFGAGLIILSVILVPVLGREVTAQVKHEI
jgi:drug/metabolite transporter (DMT)-like permease